MEGVDTSSTFLMGGVINENVFKVLEEDMLERESSEFEKFFSETEDNNFSNLPPIQFFSQKNGNGPSGRFS